MKEIYEFLIALNENNNREWFDANRETYQKTRNQFINLTDVLINEIRSFDRELPFLDPKKCVFRIFRDVRFSKDKRPYKTNYGTFIAKDGRKGGSPGYYLHIQPGELFLGAGIYMPDADRLKAIRTEIYNHPQDFIDLIEEPDFSNNFKLYDGDKLKTAPKGFPKEFENIDLLRYKSYFGSISISEEKLFSPDIVDFVIDHYRLLMPLVHFLNDAIVQQK